VKGTEGLLTKLARCCTPVPGDAIVGFVTRGRGVSVHRVDCPNIDDLAEHQEDRLVEVTWNASTAASFLVSIQVEALAPKHHLRDITAGHHYMRTGNYYYSAERFIPPGEEKLAMYRKALKTDPNFSPSFIGIATNLMYQGKHDAARAEAWKLHQAARNDADRRNAHFARAVAPCITETDSRKVILERPGYKEWATTQMLPAGDRERLLNVVRQRPRSLGQPFVSSHSYSGHTLAPSVPSPAKKQYLAVPMGTYEKGSKVPPEPGGWTLRPRGWA
jgi:hypothetical protein